MEPNSRKNESAEDPETSESGTNVTSEEVLEREEEENQEKAQTSAKAPPRHFDANGVPLTRLQIKEACRLAYCSGRSRLDELSEKYDVPYDTVRCWSRTEGWSYAQKEIAEQSRSQLVSAASEWLAEQRQGQIHRALGRGQRLQSALDVLYTDGNSMVREDGEVVRVPLCAKDLQGIAVAEERADLIIRRNLGMDDQGAGGRVNVNINNLGSLELGQ